MNTQKLLPLVLPLVLVALAPGCGKRRHVESAPVLPAFGEVESNDAVFQANDFGFLSPGDHFVIEGFITDSGADPFDGFLFTSLQSIHVDFQLFIDNGFADLDVCLYDPQIDATVDCFATASNPERGGVDVFGGGLDFHLVVESYFGASSYALEIHVQPLFGALSEAAASEGSLARVTSAPSSEVVLLRSQGHDKPQRAESFAAYGRPAVPEELRPLETMQHFDPETGVMSVLTRPVDAAD